MDTSTVSALLYRTSKPLGKVRRRVQDLRIPSSPCYDFVTSRPELDLSHNESVRLAADSLLSRGLEGYHEVLNAEGEVDFLSELEKIYILENGRNSDTADPGASDDDDKESKSLSAGSQCATQCSATSTDSDPTVVGLDLSNQKDVKWTDPVLDKPYVEVYFQCDRRAAGMKDLVRGFIRKAGMAMAIVMDSFSDVELLCDLLEASRKRNVSVYLLLDQLNLSLFVSMWQDLKLDSKDFPKLSVRSVNGQTYCAKMGKKLTGQITESFIIADWTEVLTGSYSFSWLSWQVHRSYAILMKGSAVTPFHQEFLRLYSSSEPVPGFVTFITMPHTLSLYTMLHGAQTKSKMHFLSGLRCTELECSKVNTPHRAGTGAQKHEKCPQLYLKPLVQPGALQTVDKLKPTVGAVFTQCGAQINVKPLEKNLTQIQNQSNPLSQAHVSHIQSQLTRLTISTTAERNWRAQESHGQHSCQSRMKPHLERRNVATGGLFFQQRNRNRLTEASRITAGHDKQRQQWNCSLSFKPKTGFQSDNPKLLSPDTSQQKQGKRGQRFPLPHQRGNTSGQASSQGTRRHDQPQKHHQPSTQAHPTPEATGSKSASSGVGAQLKPQLQSELFLPGAILHHTSQQTKPTPRLIWMPESHRERPRPVAHHRSFNTTYGTGQKKDGQVGWRPFHSRMNMSLGRSKSMTDTQPASLKPNKG